MADIRIKVAKDKAKLVKALRAGEGSTGPFQTYYEVLVFAAALGIKKGKFVPFQENEASREVDPIRQEQFASKGYDQVINLISIGHDRDPNLLGTNVESEAKRVAIFEGYANGGLEILGEIVWASSDISNQIILLIASENKKLFSAEEDDLDLSFL
jgi:dnd system-associated protein 4